MSLVSETAPAFVRLCFLLPCSVLVGLRLIRQLASQSVLLKLLGESKGGALGGLKPGAPCYATAAPKDKVCMALEAVANGGTRDLPHFNDHKKQRALSMHALVWINGCFLLPRTRTRTFQRRRRHARLSMLEAHHSP